MASETPPFFPEDLAQALRSPDPSSEAPPGFYILSSPNEGEPGTFSCPFEDCDGVVCGSMEDCHHHIKEWHSPPYSCAECQANFAAGPALDRHMKAAGHHKWACQKQGCELKGFDFGNHLSYRDHVLASAAHTDAAQWKKEIDQTGHDFSTLADSDLDGSDVLSDCPPHDEFMCLETCCRQYLKRLSKRQYDVHVKSHAHVAAIKESKALHLQNLSEDVLEERQQARRELRCDKEDCLLFGRTYTSSQGYYQHLEAWSHLFPEPGKKSATEPKMDDDDVFGPAKEGDSEAKRCNISGCVQFGRQFRTLASYERHINTVQHARVASPQLAFFGMNPMRYPAKLKFQLRGGTSLGETSLNAERPEHTPTPTPTPTTAWSPSTAGSPAWDTPSLSPFPMAPNSALSSPTPVGARERYLERRNRELEEEVKQLQGQLDWLSRNP
ncbi:hypothetical protein HIM_02897 [Hirsutella minnesotensis 3608]|nr:hypothetical protein HIM_02897 [Hirsutella minnesotensis 3608]